MNIIKQCLLMISLAVFSLSVWALDIDAAKSEGVVGETRSGYIAAVADKPSGEVVEFVADINSKRKLKYQSIAEKRGIPLKNVEHLAAKKAYEKTQSGHYVQDSSGHWMKK